MVSEAVRRTLKKLAPVLLLGSTCCVPDVIHGEVFDAGMPLDATATDVLITPNTELDAAPIVDAAVIEVPRAGPCDLSGPWLLTMRQVTNSIGAKQLGKAWHFVQFTQQGSNFEITRAHLCGNSNVGQAPFVLNVDDMPSWPVYAVKHDTTYWGVKGTSVETDQGCALSFDRFITLRGVSSDYLDESKPLPNADQKAVGTTPGWEDWDNDGKPGVTQNVSGTLNGLVYLAMRFWILLSGQIAKSADDFQVGIMWDVERSTLGYDGSPLFVAPASADGDFSVQFVEFARFPPGLVVDDAQALCATVRELAPKLNPKANQ